MGHGLLNFGMGHVTTDTQRKCQVARPDEEDVDSGRGGNFIDAVDRGRFFDNRDDEDIAIGKVVIALGGRPAESGQAGARSTSAGRRVSARIGGLTGQFGCAGERKRDAEDAGIEDLFGGPKGIERHARERDGGPSLGRKDDGAERVEADRRMLHFDPEIIESHGRELGSDLDVVDGDGDAEGGFALAEECLNRVFPGG